jgi:hypothetical protein
MRAVAEVDTEAFGAFREGLLRHIALEEKILFPAARVVLGGEPLPLARQLRVDHGAIAALLVPAPTEQIAREIWKVLSPHNDLEEGGGGIYELCDSLLSAEAPALLERMRKYPPVKLAHCRDGPRVCHTAEEALSISALQSGLGPKLS